MLQADSHSKSPLMTNKPIDHRPAEVARAALRRIAELQLPPTPEHFARHYYAIAGIAPPPAAAPAAGEFVSRVDDVVSHAAGVAQALAAGVATHRDDVAASLEGLVQEAPPTSVSVLLQALIVKSTVMHETLQASHAELLDARLKLTVISAELLESRKLIDQDPLTGSQNRRAMASILQREIASARRDDEPLSVAMVDIDHFKKINDTFGHAGGDAALVHITQVARSTLRGHDAFVRYGGEEFLLVLPDTGTAGAVYVAGRLQQMLARTPFSLHGQEVEITFSAGVATLLDADTEAMLVQRADGALYQAKKAGRNRVVAAE